MTGANFPARHKRIAMACQHCRHRKIKCSGSAPCVNCTRTGRICGYSPVSEEANRLARQRKAAAKAAKASGRASRVPPWCIEESAYWAPSLAGQGPVRRTHVPDPRRLSTLGIRAASLPPYWPVPPAPAMPSSAQLETRWLSGWPVPVVNDPPPRVLVYLVNEAAAPATYIATPVSSTESPALLSDPMPVNFLPKEWLNTPSHDTQLQTSTQAFFDASSGLPHPPQPFPFSSSELPCVPFATSPTSCIGQRLQHNRPQQLQQPLLGLGIGLAYSPAYHWSTAGNEEPLVGCGRWPQFNEHWVSV